jgi:hypothetical protein
MHIDFSEIQACRSVIDLNTKMQEIMARATPDDPPFLSDVIVNLPSGGHHVLVELGEMYDHERDIPEEQRFRWKIQVLRDEWGNPPNPGDKVSRKIQKELKVRLGDQKIPVPGDDLSRSIADGTYDRKYTTTVEYIVDEKGCITCGFRDAVYFLKNYGIHSKSGVPLTTKPDHSSEPVDAPNGQKLHVWYRRFKEADRNQYSQLKKIKNRTDSRGIISEN